MLTDERYKALMTQVGMPESISLLQALRQVENEVGTPLLAKIAELEANIVDLERVLKLTNRLMLSGESRGIAKGLEESTQKIAAQQKRIEVLTEALSGLMNSESRGRIMPIGKEWDAARAALNPTDDSNG